jgi:hypothetical protein
MNRVNCGYFSLCSISESSELLLFYLQFDCPLLLKSLKSDLDSLKVLLAIGIER